jgi:hypothetical protein
MTSALALQPDTVWLQRENYEIVPLNALRGASISELAGAISHGISAYPDSKRRDFYEIHLTDAWAYIHVHDAARTVYLVAYSDRVAR